MSNNTNNTPAVSGSSTSLVARMAEKLKVDPNKL